MLRSGFGLNELLGAILHGHHEICDRFQDDLWKALCNGVLHCFSGLYVNWTKRERILARLRAGPLRVAVPKPVRGAMQSRA